MCKVRQIMRKEVQNDMFPRDIETSQMPYNMEGNNIKY